MPFFSVLIEGAGLHIDSASPDPMGPITGFFATRIVWGSDPASAGRAAVSAVAKEWKAEPYVSQPGSRELKLVASTCSEVSFLRGLLNRPSGYSFFHQMTVTDR